MTHSQCAGRRLAAGNKRGVELAPHRCPSSWSLQESKFLEGSTKISEQFCFQNIYYLDQNNQNDHNSPIFHYGINIRIKILS